MRHFRPGVRKKYISVQYLILNRFEKLKLNFLFNDKQTSSSVQAVHGSSVKERIVRRSKREFRWIWLDVKGFKPWLKLNVRKRTVVYCKICKMKITAMFSSLKKHALSHSHLVKSGLDRPPPGDHFVIPERKDSEQERERAEAELEIVGMSTALDISFRSVPKIVKTIKKSDKNSKIWSRIKIGKTKARNITVKVIGEDERLRLSDILKDTFFAILVDESTDVSKDKGLAIMVRFNDPDNGRVLCKLWDIVRVFQKGKEGKATAQQLYECICDSFQKQNVPLENIFACCFDGCSTMVGQINGLKALLEEAVPGIVCVRCPAHSTHLCATHALEEIPKEIISLIQNIHAMLRSANRQHNFELLQEELYTIAHKIPKMCMTRWLSLEFTCERIIEEYDALIIFAETTANKNDRIAKQVFNQLTLAETKCFFLLIRDVLSELNALNRVLQRQDVVIHKLKAEIERRFKNIVSRILNRNYVLKTPASDIDIFNPDNYLRYDDFIINDEITYYLNEDGNNMERFCKSAYNFVISIAIQIKERFNDFENPIYNGVQCLRPENAMSMEFREKNPNAFPTLLAAFPKLSGDKESMLKLTSEWDFLTSINDVPGAFKEYDAKIEDMWFFLMKNTNVEYLSRFALFVLCTPHANADPERAFSALNRCKTKGKSRMEIETVGASLRSKQAVLASRDDVLEPRAEMVDRLLERKYYKDNN